MPFLPARRTLSQVLPLPCECEGSLACGAECPLIPSPHPRSSVPAAPPECSQQTPRGSGCCVDVQHCCYFCYFQPVAQLSDWIVEMQNSGDTSTEHLLPNQPDEHLDAKGASLYCLVSSAAFLEEQFCHGGENCRVLVLEQGFVVLRVFWEVEICLCSVCQWMQLSAGAQCSQQNGDHSLSLWFPVVYPQTQKDPELLGFPGPFLPAGQG